MKIRPSAAVQPPQQTGSHGHRSALHLKPLAAHIRRALFPGLVLGLQVGTALAGPEGGNVVGGSGSIARPDADTTVINQQSHNLAIDWQKFNVKSHELVQFNQPGRDAQALNRIFDQDASQIHGRINANGRVLLMNPNGVIFGRNSHVNVNGLGAAGMKNIPVDDFMAGKFKLEALEGADGAVVNQGTLEAATGGDITLVGKSIRNDGVILASAGRVNLAAGNKFTLDFDGDGLMRFAVDEKVLENAQALDDQISNTGSIAAEGGDVIIAASAAQDVFTNAINNSGIVRAGRIENSGGTVRLVGMGPSASVLNTGTIDVSAADTVSSGGYVDITGANIRQSGVIRATATAGPGGSVALKSSNRTTSEGDAAIIATSETNVGGTVHLLGDKVGLLEHSVVDVSGGAGGGQALIGGDYHGDNPDVKNATVTSVEQGARVSADALTQGDGGKVVVWADDTTAYAGAISARGAGDGDGGFAEVSGKETLLFAGTADLSAANGALGTLLLDPATLTITDAAAGGDHDLDLPDIVAGAGGIGGNTVSWGAIDALGAAANLVLEATGLITINNVMGTAGGTTTAADLVMLNLTTGSLTIRSTGGSVVFADTNDVIRTEGGMVRIEANGAAGAITAGGFDTTGAGGATSGDVTLQAGTSIDVRAIDTGGGIVVLEADSDANGSGTFTTNGVITTSGGAVHLLGEDAVINQNIITGAGNISYVERDGDALELGGGAPELAQAEIDRFMSTGTVTIGEAMTGDAVPVTVTASDINVEGTLTIAAATAGTFVLRATDSVFIGDAGSAAETVALTVNPELMVQADADGDGSGNFQLDDNINARKPRGAHPT